jgi:hypothetical protein
MRIHFIGAIGMAILASAPAMANPLQKPMGRIILYVPSETQTGGEVPSVARGEQFGVDCGCLRDRNAEVRVVLSLAKNSGEAPTGYDELLATEQRFDRGALRVRMPDAPGLANHTVDVKVYVVGAKGARTCTAGRIRIT